MIRDRLPLLAAMVVIVSTVVGGVAFAATDSDAGAQPAVAATNKSSTILVSASGSLSSNPDKTVIRLGVEASAENATVARQRVAANVSAMRAALEELGLNESQIRSTDYNLYRDHRRERPPRDGDQPPEIVYEVRHSLAIEVDNVSRTGAVIDSAIANGATNLHDIQFTLSGETRSQLRDRALEQAMRNARSKAETLATSANLTISGVDVVTTVDDGRRIGPVGTPAPTQVAEAGGDTEISSGPVSVTVSVQVRYRAAA